MKLRLTGAHRYNLNGELYLSHEPDGRTQVVYSVDDEKAAYLLEQYDPQSGYAYFDKYEGPNEGKAPGKVDDIDKVPRRERGESERRRRDVAPAERQARPARMGPRNQDISLRTQPGSPGIRQRAARPIEEDVQTDSGVAV